MIHTSASAGIYGGMKIPVAIAVKPLHGCFSRSVGTHRGLIMARRLTASEALHSVLERDYSSDKESEIDEAYSFPLPRPPSDEELPASPARASSPAYCCTPHAVECRQPLWLARARVLQVAPPQQLHLQLQLAVEVVVDAHAGMQVNNKRYMKNN